MSDMLYTFANNDYFLPPSTLGASKAIEQLLTELLPADWQLVPYNIWLGAAPAQDQTPEQGFKIHLSTTRADMIPLLRAALPLCIARQCAFKVISRYDLATHMASKSVSRGSAGKFVTIYPRTEAEFVQLMAELHQATSDLKGPYILSDRRYRDSKVLHYRYGGFKLIQRLDDKGKPQACIRKPDGELVPDIRTPYYSLPDWVTEPFPDLQLTSQDIPVLNQRFQVEQALSFSNSGGVYKALDLQTQQQVVVKEARPFVQFYSRNNQEIFADQVLHCEYSILERLAGSRFFPQPVAWFTEWEHSYLVETLVSGEPLRTFRARSEMTLVPFAGSVASAERYHGHFLWLARECIAAVQAAHRRGVVLADISPNNIMVDVQQQQISFIDFEGAYIFKKQQVQDAAVLTTPGFSDSQSFMKKGACYAADWYALGMVLYSTLLPVQQAFDTAPHLRVCLLNQLISDCGLHPLVGEIITALTRHQPGKALKLLDALSSGTNPALAEEKAQQIRHWPATSTAAYPQQLSAVTAGLAELVKQGLPLAQDNHFIPIDYAAYSAHPLALVYGYYGPAVMVQRLCQQVPDHLQQKLVAESARQPELPGLFQGSAGMALAELELGNIDRALHFADLTLDSSQLYSQVDFAQGMAGIGFMLLAVYQHSQEQRYLQAACALAQRLQDQVEQRSEGLCYPLADGKIRVGFGHGNSGIALFFLHLYQTTAQQTDLEFGEALLAYDLHCGLQPDGNYQWGEFSGSKQILPYWQSGSSGVGAVVIRYYHATGRAQYLQQAEAIALASYSRYAGLQGSCSGMAGIIEFYTDMFQCTGQHIYQQQALDLAYRVSLFAVPRQIGLIYPGRMMIRLSTDFAFGSAGVALMLHRVLHGGPRLLMDLPVQTHSNKSEALC
jgi:hypothetical protein